MSTFSKPKILLSTLFSKTISLSCSLSARNETSHPHKSTGEITITYDILHFTGNGTIKYGTDFDVKQSVKKVKVKLPYYEPGQALRAPEG
jgi:hypothetical protein